MAKPKTPRILILGRGRLGGALARALHQAGHQVRLAPGTTARPGGADVVFLCVPDAEVARVAARLARSIKGGAVVAHCAGALPLSVLAPLSRKKLSVGSMHPLQAVPSPETRLFGHAAIAGDTLETQELLAGLARDAGLTPFALLDDDRPLYHAAAALASNGLVALAARCARLLEMCRMEEGDALAALIPLMLSSLDGLSREGLPGALTGPIARGDEATIRTHLAALARVTPADRDLYRILAWTQVPLARQLGQARVDDLDRIGEALTNPDRAPAPGRRPGPRAGRPTKRPRRGRASRGPRSS